MTESVDPLAHAFGKRLCELRETANLTQSELARRAVMKRAYVWRVEDGRTLPSLRTAKKLADALGIDIAQLVAGL